MRELLPLAIHLLVTLAKLLRQFQRSRSGTPHLSKAA
jgi:hypothetical protein